MIAEYADLRRGIVVRGAGLARSRFALSSGTVVPIPQQGLQYHPNARIPSTPWRDVTPREYRMLCGPSMHSTPWRHHADVAVLRVADDLLAPLREICHDCGYYRTPTGADPRQHPAWAAALEDLVEALACYRVEGAHIDASALYRAEAGQAAVTRTNREVPGSELTLGLHVDSWEGTPLRYRASVRNRLCINLGHEPRYLAFINLTLADVLRAVEPRDATDLEAISLFAGHEFMARCPHYPVTRLRLDPNELYIAPTGNMIHDGVAPEGVQPDVALHLLGFFAPPSMCAAAGREQYADGR